MNSISFPRVAAAAFALFLAAGARAQLAVGQAAMGIDRGDAVGVGLAGVEHEVGQAAVVGIGHGRLVPVVDDAVLLLVAEHAGHAQRLLRGVHEAEEQRCVVRAHVVDHSGVEQIEAV